MINKMSFLYRKIFLILLFTLNIFAADQYGEIYTKEEKNWIKEHRKVKVAMLNNFVPFSYVDKNKHLGFTVELLEKISSISGLGFEIETSRWSPALQKFKNGEVDMICGISHTKKRENYTLFTKPYYEIPTFIFGLKKNIEYKDNDSLKDKKVGVSKNIFYIADLKKFGIKVVEFGSSFEKAKALVGGKIDYFLSSYTSGNKAITDQALTSIKVMDEYNNIKKEDLRFGINKDKALLYSIMEKSLSIMDKEELRKLSQKWIFNYKENNPTILNLTQKEREFIQQNPVIRYSEVNWKPLSIIKNDQMKGLMGDYLQLVSLRTGLKFQYVPSRSWPNVLAQFKNKKIDFVPGIGTSSRETQLGLVSKTYAQYPMVIVTDQKYTYFDDLSELNTKTIAVPKFYTSYNFLKQNYPGIKLMTTADIAEALMLVESGKADAFLGHIATSLFYISELHLNNLKISGVADFNFEHKYLVQRDNPLLLSIINKAFDSITDIEKKEIYSKWIQTTITEKKVDYSLGILVALFSFIIITILIYRHKELKNANNKIEGILNSTMEGIIISERGKCIDVNEEVVKLFEYNSKDDVIGKYLVDFFAPESKEIGKKNLALDNVKPYEYKLLKSTGEKFDALARGHNVKLNRQTIRVSSIIDITDIKRKEQIFHEQTKLAAMGEMIGNIAHQWRQPLSIIATGATGLKLHKQSGILRDEFFYQVCDSINDNAQYLSQTINDFRDFIKGERKKVLFNVSDNLNSFLHLVEGTIKNGDIQVIKNINNEITLISYPNELIQCCINIFNNSKDALKNVKNNKFIFISADLEDDRIVISFKDNAGGIPENILPHIFEPYFTTKHQSRGTGLGLYICYNIIKSMDGDIEVNNHAYVYEGKRYNGAQFLIKLPYIRS